jgi:hypothetical protein
MFSLNINNNKSEHKNSIDSELRCISFLKRFNSLDKSYAGADVESEAFSL